MVKWCISGCQQTVIAYSCDFRMKSISCKHNYCYIILPPVHDSPWIKVRFHINLKCHFGKKTFPTKLNTDNNLQKSGDYWQKTINLFKSHCFTFKLDLWSSVAPWVLNVPRFWRVQSVEQKPLSSCSGNRITRVSKQYRRIPVKFERNNFFSMSMPQTLHGT